MTPITLLRGRIAFCAAALFLVLLPTASKANVYATNVRLNGGATNVVSGTGTNVTISYLLNEPASLGATVQILSGSTPVRTITIPAGSPGTLTGTNAVVWDGTGDGSTTLTTGAYSVSITAVSSGYTNWTQITTDTNIGNIVSEPNGIAVDSNANSPYYGRVFVTISLAANNPGTNPPPGDTVGILKLNADGSLADDGLSTTGGHNWEGDSGLSFSSPWKIAVSPDDYVYVNDLWNTGEIYRWDPLISTNSLLYVLRPDNYGATNILSGPFISGSGANARLWMVDNNGYRGVIRYAFSTNGACATNDTGLNVVGVGTATNNLSLYPYDVALDKNGVIYVAQDSPLYGGDLGNAGPRVLRFPAYNPATNGNLPELKADWTFGGDTNSSGAYAVAVDPTGTYLAASFVGYLGDNGMGGLAYFNGNTKVLFATNGAVATELDLGAVLNGVTNHFDTACAWDPVGNLYYTDSLANGDLGGTWRAVSPPGTNQATTASIAYAIIGNPQFPLQITKITTSAGQVTLTFTSQPGDNPALYTLLGTPKLGTGFAPVAGAFVSSLGGGVYQATVPVSFSSAPVQFYRLKR
jgi:hypothetical protein